MYVRDSLLPPNELLPPNKLCKFPFPGPPRLSKIQGNCLKVLIFYISISLINNVLSSSRCFTSGTDWTTHVEQHMIPLSMLKLNNISKITIHNYIVYIETRQFLFSLQYMIILFMVKPIFRDEPIDRISSVIRSATILDRSRQF